MSSNNEIKPHHPVHFKRKLAQFLINLFVWLGVVVLYYIAFSFFFFTPVEYEMNKSVAQLEKEYDKLSERYDTLETVLNNVAERDKNVFRTLFESEPLIDNKQEQRLQLYDTLLRRTNRELGDSLFNRISAIENKARQLSEDFTILQNRAEVRGLQMNHIPSIQPIINEDLTRITTSYGMRVHPFYKTMVMHQGVDYAVPEGTRVFATANGTVSNVGSGRNSTGGGLSITISHGGGYETIYNHLSKTMVREGQKVKRGDIIALTGNTGLSLAPHLHYEVKFNGMRVDPVHYFFSELSPEKYEKIKRLAAVGMQSFD